VSTDSVNLKQPSFLLADFFSADFLNQELLRGDPGVPGFPYGLQILTLKCY